MNSSFSWPAIYVNAKGPGVFQAISFPEGPPSHYSFHKVVQFSGSHPRGAWASSNKSVYATSLGTMPMGAWFALLMRLGFLVGDGKQQSGDTSLKQGTHLLSQAWVHADGHRVALLSISSLLPSKGYLPWNPWYYGWVAREQLVYKGISCKCSHLALTWGCRSGKSHRPGQMASVEGENTTSLPSPGSRSFLLQRWARKAWAALPLLPLPLKCVLSTPIARAPAAPKTHSSADQFTCPPGGDSVTDIPTGDAG